MLDFLIRGTSACQSEFSRFSLRDPHACWLQCPTDGIITFVDETGTVLAQGPATPCGTCQIGLTVSFSSQGGSFGIGYGSHSGETTFLASPAGRPESKFGHSPACCESSSCRGSLRRYGLCHCLPSCAGIGREAGSVSL